MPRYPRLFIPDLPLHIVQRGHDRKPVFVRDDDYRFYLANLRETKAKLGVRVVAYCLMTNHIHLILVPGEDTSAVSSLMRIVAARQTRRVNKLERRTGTLWEGRFKASLIDTDRYLLACCRYVDLNPVRAGIVSSPGAYRWSGYRGRAGISSDGILDPHTIFEALGHYREQQCDGYRRLVADRVNDDELLFIRQALNRNQFTGREGFRRGIEMRIGRRVSAKGPGRPRKVRDG